MSTPDDNDTIHVQWYDWPIYNHRDSKGRSDFKPWRLRRDTIGDARATELIPIVPVPAAGCKRCVSEGGNHGTDCTRTPHCDGVVWMDARDPEALVKYVAWRMTDGTT